MKVFGRILALSILAAFIGGMALTATQFAPGEASRLPNATRNQPHDDPVPVKSGTSARAEYSCDLRVFMVEQEGRWNDNDDIPFDNNFLTFAFDTTLSLAYQETYQETKIWSAGMYANPDFVTQENMMAIAVLYNTKVSGYGDSDPYDPYASFHIHLVDACAAATHGNPGSDMSTENSTHTVLVEDASTTW